MDTPRNNTQGPLPRRPWVRFASALAIIAALVTAFEVVPRRRQGLDRSRLARSILIAVAAAAFISFGPVGRR